jgi:hypothetical protein
MNNNASSPSTNPTKKCRAVFPYDPSLGGRLAGEHTVVSSGGLGVLYSASKNQDGLVWTAQFGNELKVKSLCLIKYCTMKTYAFLTTALNIGETENELQTKITFTKKITD